MIAIQHFSLIQNHLGFEMYFQSDHGSYIKEIIESAARRIQYVLDNKPNLHKQLLQISQIEFEYCYIYETPQGLLGDIVTKNQTLTSLWYEALIIAIELKLPLYMQENLIKAEFDPTDTEHENFVNEIILQEQMYEYSMQIKKLMQKITQAEIDERYEDAIKYRDSLQKLQKTKGKQSND